MDFLGAWIQAAMAPWGAAGQGGIVDAACDPAHQRVGRKGRFRARSWTGARCNRCLFQAAPQENSNEGRWRWRAHPVPQHSSMKRRTQPGRLKGNGGFKPFPGPRRALREAWESNVSRRRLLMMR